MTDEDPPARSFSVHCKKMFYAGAPMILLAPSPALATHCSKYVVTNEQKVEGNRFPLSRVCCKVF